jgi:hypothetical protein
MRTIAKLNVLIREGIELLDDIGLVTEEFKVRKSGGGTLLG